LRDEAFRQDEALLERLQAGATPETRLIVNFQSNLWRPLLRHMKSLL